MAQFRGTIQGNRGEASRLGHKTSGLKVECDGWNSGITVVASYNSDTDTDEFRVYLTGGSSGGDYILLTEVNTDKAKLNNIVKGERSNVYQYT